MKQSSTGPERDRLGTRLAGTCNTRDISIRSIHLLDESIILTKKSTPNSLRTRWGEGRRLEFIEFRLLWERTINRSELMEFFGISAQQASADLAKYMQIAPDNIAYDKRRKAYCATPQLTPALVTPDAQAYLQSLREQGETGGAAGGSFMGWRAPVDVVRMPSRSIAPDVLMRLLWAMRDGAELQVRYQSMRRPSATRRWIAPHAFAFDGLRWHARAWCHENHDFRDFVLSRILEVAAERPTEIDSTSDAWWHSFVEVAVRPRVGLTTGQRAAIESDFGMHGGRLVLRSRKALAFYLLRHLRLDRESDEPPAAQPLELVNSVDLIDVLAAGRKSPAIPLGTPPSTLRNPHMSNDKHHFFVDGKKFETDRTALKGIEIKQMAAIDVTFQLFLEGRGQDPDSQVSDGQDVILDTPPKQFYSVPPATFGKS